LAVQKQKGLIYIIQQSVIFLFLGKYNGFGSSQRNDGSFGQMQRKALA